MERISPRHRGPAIPVIVITGRREPKAYGVTYKKSAYAHSVKRKRMKTMTKRNASGLLSLVAYAGLTLAVGMVMFVSIGGVA